MRISKHASVLAACASLCAACATPPAVLEQATFSAAAMGQLQDSMAAYRAKESAFEKTSLVMLAQVQQATADVMARNGPELRAWEAVGDPAMLTAMARLRAEADGLASDAGAVDATATANAKKLAGLLTAIPDTSASVLAAQKAMAAMSIELSQSERLRWAQAFVKATAAAAKADKKKIDAAQKAADAARKKATMTVTEEVAATVTNDKEAL